MCTLKSQTISTQVAYILFTLVWRAAFFLTAFHTRKVKQTPNFYSSIDEKKSSNNQEEKEHKTKHNTKHDKVENKASCGIPDCFFAILINIICFIVWISIHSGGATIRKQR